MELAAGKYSGAKQCITLESEAGPQDQQHWGNTDDGEKVTDLKTGEVFWKLLPLPSETQLTQ